MMFMRYARHAHIYICMYLEITVLDIYMLCCDESLVGYCVKGVVK